MVNWTSVFSCLKRSHRQELLHEQGLHKADAEGLSSGQAAGLSFIAIALYLAVGTVAFYLAENYYEDQEWSWVDSLYFCVVTVSTVGYGDSYTPGANLTRWMAIFYMFFAIALLGLALGVLGGFLMERQEELLMKAMQRRQASTRRRILNEGNFKILTAILVLFFFLSIGVLAFYFILESAETDTFLDAFTNAVFLTVQTVTTVGYGSPTIPNEWGRAFAIPYILLSTLLVAAALGTVADVVIERRQERLANKILTAEFDLEAILAMDTDGDQQIDMAEFLEYMLINMGKVNSMEIERVKAQFHKLDVDNSGVLDQEDIRIMKEQARQQQAKRRSSTIQ